MPKIRSHWSHREQRAISSLLFRAMIVLIGLYLLALLTGCENTRTVYVPAPMVPISTDLTADTPIPGMEIPFTWRASLELNVKLYSALRLCNLDKAGIRKIEKQRVHDTSE